MPSCIRIAAAATEPMCARAPAPSVTLIASARPFNGAALAIRSAASNDTGGAISAVMTKWSVASFSLRFIRRLFSNSCPVSSAVQWAGRRHAHLARRGPAHRVMPMPAIAPTLDEALAAITDGCVLAVPRESTGAAMAATRALIRRGVRRLTLIALPTSSLQADLLIGAGCVETLETSAVSMGEFGAAPRFTAAVLKGSIRMKDATCPALHAGVPGGREGRAVHAAARIDRHRCAEQPAGLEGRRQSVRRRAIPIVLLPAIKPEVALFHAPMADRDGNVWVGRQRELVTMAHAAERTIVTVERLHDGNLLEDKTLAAGTLPGFYVDQVAVVERGAWPLPLPDYYAWDAGHLKEYVTLAATDEGFAQYLDKYVHERQAA